MTFATPRRLRVRRLGQIRLEPRRADLLDHVAPTRAALHRHLHRPGPRTPGQLFAQPTTKPLTIRLPQPTTPHIARLHIDNIESDLLSMQIQPTYHPHQGPPHSCPGTGQTARLPGHEPRRSSHMDC